MRLVVTVGDDGRKIWGSSHGADSLCVRDISHRVGRQVASPAEPLHPSPRQSSARAATARRPGHRARSSRLQPLLHQQDPTSPPLVDFPPSGPSQQTKAHPAPPPPPPPDTHKQKPK